MKKKYIALAVFNALCLIIFIVLSCIVTGISNSFDSQSAVDKWSTDEYSSFAYISVFFNKENGKTKNDVYMARSELQQELTTEGLINVSTNDDAVSYTDAFSAYGQTSVTRNGTSADVNVTATGGNYFLFHPEDIVTGDYYYDNDLMKDRILIDNYLAWQLFGSNDVVGMNVEINGKTFLIAGVFKRPEGKYIDYTYGDKSRIYMPFDTFVTMNEGENAISYEVCLPNPIKGYGKDVVIKSLGITEDDCAVVESSKRFTDASMWNFTKNYNKKFIADNDIVYPFWENSQRIAEAVVAKLFVSRIICLVPVLVTIIYLAISGYRKMKKNKAKIINKFKGLFKRKAVEINDKSTKHTQLINSMDSTEDETNKISKS